MDYMADISGYQNKKMSYKARPKPGLDFIAVPSKKSATSRAKIKYSEPKPLPPPPIKEKPVEKILPVPLVQEEPVKKTKSDKPEFSMIGKTLPNYESSSSSSGRTRNRKSTNEPKKKKKITIKRAILVILIIVIMIIGYEGLSLLKNVHKLFHGNIFGVFTNTKLKGEDRGRVNILLAGNSADDTGHDGAQLTDSIMLVSVDTKNNTGFALSIPRDLWVNIPGGGHQKINAAYVVGENSKYTQVGYPNGGMGLLEQIVSQDLGIPIDYYALLNYNGIKDAVNAVGGITVNIQSSDPRGLYDPSIDYATNKALVKLTNGPHVLDGEAALDLARARGDTYGSYGYINSDFERTFNQRLMLVALKDKASSTGVVSNPVKLNSLLSSVGNNVKTDVGIADVKEMYRISKLVPNSSIQSLSFQNAYGVNLLKSYISDNGQDALSPRVGVDDYSELAAYIQKLTSANPIVVESAPVVVLNGTSTTGLATTTKTKLTNSGLNVIAVGDTTASPTTQIIDVSSGKYPSTKKYLQSIYGKNIITSSTLSSAYPSASFIVVLGQNAVTAGSKTSTTPTN